MIISFVSRDILLLRFSYLFAFSYYRLFGGIPR